MQTTMTNKLVLNKEQFAAFEELSRPLMEWLSNNADSHAKVIITSTNADLLGGVAGVYTLDYVKD